MHASPLLRTDSSAPAAAAVRPAGEACLEPPALPSGLNTPEGSPSSPPVPREGLGGTDNLRGPAGGLSLDTPTCCCCCCSRSPVDDLLRPLKCSLSLPRPVELPLAALTALGLMAPVGLAAAACELCWDSVGRCSPGLYSRLLGRQWIPSSSTVHAAWAQQPRQQIIRGGGTHNKRHKDKSCTGVDCVQSYLCVAHAPLPTQQPFF
jgi:hypothetical protein